uniref:ARAD1A00330p n=1 Tax=Blastobotrys adeninivorans TaxID=409370 RepID=A0A060T297_BLAAD
MSSEPTVPLKQRVDEIFNGLKDRNPNWTQEQITPAKKVIELFESAFIYRDFDNVKRIVTNTYVQHNPFLHDDPYSIIEFGKWKRSIAKETQNFDGPPALIYHRIMVDGDLVYVQLEWRNHPGDLGINIMDLLRWNKDLQQFTEHWDANQEVPPKDKRNNQNGIFD